ncbi:OsmC family protein [Streptomyces nigra]|uniref:OsmC family protein n=1 Tax=Streptomyces nigra TaxID=1827580 RepID=UPI0036A70362
MEGPALERAAPPYRRRPLLCGSGRRFRPWRQGGRPGARSTSRIPKERGGPGGATNPEQLCAAGWASCFRSALEAVAARRKTQTSDSAVVVEAGPRRRRRVDSG